MLGIPLSPQESLICYGTEEGRALAKRVVARSSVHFVVCDDGVLSRCLEDLRLFSAVLRNRPATEVNYGWGRITLDRSARRIAFDLNWYDRDYFHRRRGAYASRFHAEVLRRFNLSPSDLTVSHFVHDEPNREA
jgi:hypothetical protein